jgi:hypothetical protein
MHLHALLHSPDFCAGGFILSSRFRMFSTPHGHKKIKDNPYQDYLSVTEQTPENYKMSR